MPKPEPRHDRDREREPDALWKGVLEVFRKNGWHHEPVSGRQVVETGFEAHHGRIYLHVQAYPPLRAVSVVSQSPTGIGLPAARSKAAELLQRANERLNLGAFEMRWDGGEVMFRIGNVFADGRVEPEVLTWMVETAVVEMDRLLPCLGVLSRATAAGLLLLDMGELLDREEWLPEVVPPN